MVRELVPENVEQHQLFRREKLGWSEVWGERNGGEDLAEEGRGGEDRIEQGGPALARGGRARSELEIPLDKGVADGLVKFRIVTGRVD
jgi:hypothetical protein